MRIPIALCATLVLASSALAQDNLIQSIPSLLFPQAVRPKDTAITFSQGGPTSKLVFSIRMNGTVTFGEGFSADDASREFWKHLGRNIPNKCER